MSQRCKVPAEVGLIEMQNTFQITDAQGPFMEEIEDSHSIRVCQGLQHL